LCSSFFSNNDYGYEYQQRDGCCGGKYYCVDHGVYSDSD